MPVQTEHRFPLHLSVLDAGSRVTLADLRGPARAVAVYFMRTGTCPVCIQHARALARWIYPLAACSRWWWCPARRRTPPGSGASPATGPPSCPPPAPRRTRRRDRTGPCSFNTAASCPPAASTAQRCKPRPAGSKTPAVLPQRATKG